jgi:hypothetical protein
LQHTITVLRNNSNRVRTLLRSTGANFVVIGFGRSSGSVIIGRSAPLTEALCLVSSRTDALENQVRVIARFGLRQVPREE